MHRTSVTTSALVLLLCVAGCKGKTSSSSETTPSPAASFEVASLNAAQAATLTKSDTWDKRGLVFKLPASWTRDKDDANSIVFKPMPASPPSGAAPVRSASEATPAPTTRAGRRARELKKLEPNNPPDWAPPSTLRFQADVRLVDDLKTADAQINAMYDAARAPSKREEIGSARLVDIGGMRGVLTEDVAPAEPTQNRTLRFVGFRQWRDQAQYVTLIASTSAAEFAANRDDLMGMILAVRGTP